MYEQMTYELLLQRMLDRVPSDVDKREGSIIYDALAPAAVELQNMYIQLEAVLNEGFADTQSRSYLIRRAGERGIVPEAATFAVLRGVFNKDIPIGSRFSLGILTYTAIEKMADGSFKLQCETAGQAGNQLETLIPIDYIADLTRAEATEILVPGEDEETTEKLRARYYANLDSKSFGGNIQDYKEKVNALSGIGGVKVYPVWNGGGTVRLTVISSAYESPSSVLVDEVQEAVDPVGHTGEGYGLAPIGHRVTVGGVKETEVHISTHIVYQEGWNWEDVKDYVLSAIDRYFMELAGQWSEEKNLIVRISQIETRLLNVPGIIDIADTTINELTQNLILDSDCIPKRGDVIG
ncbi:baseplate J/gp47 family protein [Aminipila butyrica]|uniref:Baseplate J/gp47 family protein n=1 Tax=Aminipila butyrica TaxID=433296 RepID=A0A858BU93_9FIRM|nr:baseplate J/gp47 family protein [Aminipila butyrica]QIB68645.1 baseplate J/gp47 family protein [Aminipila butyrica]